MSAGEPLRVPLVADADVLMNLVATGQCGRILTELRLTLLIAPRVESETLFLEPDDPGGERVSINLDPLARTGDLARAALDPIEVTYYVELAQEVDDGEAQAIALAQARGIRLASDDRRAGRAAARRGVTVVTTPELAHEWERRLAPGAPLVAQCLGNVERRAHYRPRRGHDLHSWWVARILALRPPLGDAPREPEP